MRVVTLYRSWYTYNALATIPVQLGCGRKSGGVVKMFNTKMYAQRVNLINLWLMALHLV
jgi:hypothetical protein